MRTRKKVLLGGVCALILAIVLFGMLLSGSFFSVSYMMAPASLKEHSSSFLADVIGFDLTEYAIVSSGYVPSTCLVSSSGLPIVSMSYDLQSSENKVYLNFYYTKQNDTYTLESYSFIYLDSAAFVYPPYPTDNLLNWTKMFLENYQNFQSGASYISEMRTTLATVDQLEPLNVTGTNVKLQISIRQFTEEDIYTTFTFLYTSEGVDYTGKALVLDYHNWRYVRFSDTWNQIKVGNEHIIIQQDEAIELAWQRAQTYVQNKYANESAKPQLKSIPELANLRAEHAGTGIYNPQWRIKFSFQEPFYSTQDARTISTVEVSIWAYNKEIAACYTTYP